MKIINFKFIFVKTAPSLSIRLGNSMQRCGSTSPVVRVNFFILKNVPVFIEINDGGSFPLLKTQLDYFLEIIMQFIEGGPLGMGPRNPVSLGISRDGPMIFRERE